MAVYSQPRKGGNSAVLQPTIKAISALKYQSVPGADIVFPNTGRYQLELSCTLKTQGNFQPFQLKYDVVVAPGATAPASNNVETSSLPKKPTESQKTAVSTTEQQGDLSSSQSAAQWFVAAITVSTILGFGILGLVLR